MSRQNPTLIVPVKLNAGAGTSNLPAESSGVAALPGVAVESPKAAASTLFRPPVPMAGIVSIPSTPSHSSGAVPMVNPGLTITVPSSGSAGSPPPLSAPARLEGKGVPPLATPPTQRMINMLMDELQIGSSANEADCCTCQGCCSFFCCECCYDKGDKQSSKQAMSVAEMNRGDNASVQP